MQKILYISESAIKENSIIETNADAKIISNTILEVQDLELQPILGADLYAAIGAEIISASTISGYTITDTNKTLLDEYIAPFLIYGTLVNAFVPMHYKFTNKGVNRKNDENATTIDSKELEYVKSHYVNKFDTYKQRLIKHLAIDLKDIVPYIVDSTSETTGWYLPDFETNINLQDYFEGLANKTGFYGGYYRRF